MANTSLTHGAKGPGFNCLSSAVNRRARGYCTVKHMTTIPHFVADKLL
jgi:hypothetical protein